MTDRYYLLRFKYRHFIRGTLMRYDGTNISDMSSNISSKFNDNISSDWIEITKDEAFFLINKDINTRNSLNEKEIFHKIKKLNISDQCYYFNGSYKINCTIIGIVSTDKGLIYKIKTEHGSIIDVPSSRIELLDQNNIILIPNKQPIETDPNITQTSSECSRKSPEDNQGSIVNVRCDKNNLDIVNHTNIRLMDDGDSCNKFMLLKQGSNTTSAVTLKWKGKVNGEMCLGCVLSKDCKYGTDGTFNDRKLFECAKKRAVLIVVDGNMECCEIDGKNHDDINTGDNGFIEEKCVCCAESRVPLSADSHIGIYNRLILKNDLNGTVRWTGIINGEDCVGVEMDNYKSGTDGTFNGMKIFDSLKTKAVLIKLKDIYEDIPCDIIDFKVLNPMIWRSTESTGPISKYLVFAMNGGTTTVEVKWLGRVGGRECIGCVLPCDYKHGTDGTFWQNNLFKCSELRGVLTAIEFGRECVIGNFHEQVRTTDTMFIVESSICCIEPGPGIVEDAMCKKHIVHIGTKRRFVEYRWRGRINGKEAVGFEQDSFTNGGTDGSFCGVKLFQCSKGRGILCQEKDVKHENILEFFRGIFLERDYDLGAISRIHCEDLTGESVQVEDHPIIIGKESLCFALFDQLLVEIEIDPEYLVQNYDQLKEIPFYDSVTGKRNMLIVKKDCIRKFQGNSPSEKKTSIVKLDSVNIDKSDESISLQKDGTVLCRHGLEASTDKGQEILSLDDIKCVGVADHNGTCDDASVTGEIESEIVETNFVGNFGTQTSVDTNVNSTQKENGQGNDTVQGTTLVENEWDVVAMYHSESIQEGYGVWKGIKIDHPVRHFMFEDGAYLYGLVRWIGKDNSGKYLCGLELEDVYPGGTDGTFNNEKLFKCECGHGLLVPVTSVTPDTRPYKSLIKEIYLNQKYDLKIGTTEIIPMDLLKVEDNPPIFGRHLFDLRLFGKCFAGIRIDDQSIPDNALYEDIVFADGIVGESRVIIARSERVKPFNDVLKCLPGSDVIDVGSIKIREMRESNQFVLGDIVRYDCNYDASLGRIVVLILLNDVPCVGMVKSIDIGDDARVIYIREDAAKKMHVDFSDTEYLEKTVLDPRSIVTFVASTVDHLSVSDEVEFKLAFNLRKFQGHVIMLAVGNGVPCAVIQLNQSDGIDSAKYGINNVAAFKAIKSRSDKVMVIVVSNTVHVIPEKLLQCDRNNVCLLDPATVTLVDTLKVYDMMITLKCKNRTIAARLRWLGHANNIMYLGCEMRLESVHGTDGTFSGRELFKCPDRKGVLIPLSGVSECCVNGHHQELDIYLDDRVRGSSLCCATMLEKVGNLTVGKRVMRRNDQGNTFGICRWLGVVKDQEIIGVEMVGCAKNGDDELDFFDCPSGKRGFFLSRDFVDDPVGYSYCSKNDVFFIDASSIMSERNGVLIEKTIIFTLNEVRLSISILWRGVVNDVFCVGSTLSNLCECGTDGVFGKLQLFKCKPGEGVLIPVKLLPESCEHGSHKEVVQFDTGDIDPYSVCCMRTVGKFDDRQSLKIGSKLRDIRGKDVGNCKWIGLINEKECIGVNKKRNSKEEKCSFIDSFVRGNGRGVLYFSKDIEHDVEGEKLHILEDNMVDVSKVWKIKNIDVDTVFKRGDYVSMKLGRQGENYNGELKWMGTINKVKCVGIDLEEELLRGMNGEIRDRHRFACLARHGVVTPMDNVVPAKYLRPPSFKNGMIDANKYLICVEEWDEGYLMSNNVTKDGLVFIMINNDGRSKRKGTLRWCGTMNGERVAVVEMDRACDYGTDGRFWRRQLINCNDRRAVAVSLTNIKEYIPYKQVDIPIEKRLFENIDLNSAVLCYIPQNGTLKNFYGTVKWTGIDEDDVYNYGIELDDRFNNGTDGEFKGQRLFNCQRCFGILVPMDEVAPDVRFVQIVLSDKDIPESYISTEYQLSLPVRTWDGEDYGIQGNNNSCYFDSAIFALFSKSDVLDFMISPTINEVENDEITREFRNIMAWNIVYSLRQFGFVSFHMTQKMRNVIKNYGKKFEEMTKLESDMENVAALLAKLSPMDQLLRLSTFADPSKIYKNKCMFLQLFVTLDNPVMYISSQEMLDISMVQNVIMFDEPPTCLIMQAPRDARGISCYENVLPSRMIEISNLCFNSHKQCSKCDEVALFLCKQCVESQLHMKEAIYCDAHKCTHEGHFQIPDSSSYSKSQIQMHLKAIICIEKAHFVAYVKEDEFMQKWLFFDSMSTQNIENNYSVPKVSYDQKVTEFLRLDEEDMRRKLEHYTPSDLKRIVKDSYIFVYHNSTKTCY